MLDDCTTQRVGDGAMSIALWAKAEELQKQVEELMRIVAAQEARLMVLEQSAQRGKPGPKPKEGNG